MVLICSGKVSSKYARPKSCAYTQLDFSLPCPSRKICPLWNWMPSALQQKFCRKQAVISSHYSTKRPEHSFCGSRTGKKNCSIHPNGSGSRRSSRPTGSKTEHSFLKGKSAICRSTRKFRTSICTESQSANHGCL